MRTIFTRARWIAIGLALASLTAVFAQEAIVYNRGVSITAGTLSITSRTINALTLPNATDTLVGKATTDILTNKTLSSPTFTGSTKFCTTEFVAVTGTTGTTLTNVVGLTGFSLDAAGTYQFEIHLATVGTTNSGVKVGLGYTTLTATSIQSTAVGAAAAAVVTQMTTTSTSGMTLFGSTTATMDVLVKGRLVVNAAGTVAIQAAQNAAHADETKVLVGSYATFTKIS